MDDKTPLQEAIEDDDISMELVFLVNLQAFVEHLLTKDTHCIKCQRALALIRENMEALGGGDMDDAMIDTSRTH